MPRRRRRSVPTPAWDRDRGAIGRQIAGQSPRFYGAAAVLLLTVLGVGLVVYAFASDWRADQQRPGSTAIRVGEAKYTVEYYTERLRLFVEQVGGASSQQGSPTTAMPLVADQITAEAITNQFASEFELAATEDEIKNEIAAQFQIPSTDPTFETRYQEEVARNGVTEDQYREIVRAEVLRKKLVAKFQGEIPASAESIKYRQIVVATQTEADNARRQIEGGGDFAELAKTVSLDTATKDLGGDAGWAPRGMLDTAIEDTLFALEPGGVTTYPTGQQVLVLQVTEKAADRAIDEAQKPQLAQGKLQDWLTEKRASVEVVNEMDLENGNEDKIAHALKRAYPST